MPKASSKVNCPRCGKLQPRFDPPPTMGYVCSGATSASLPGSRSGGSYCGRLFHKVNTRDLPLAISIFIFNQEGKVLQIARKAKGSKGETKYGLVGGKVDQEDLDLEMVNGVSALKYAAIREALEEAGITITADDLLGIFNGEIPGVEPPAVDYWDVAFVVQKVFSDQDIDTSYEGLAHRWVTLDQLVSEGPFAEFNRQVVEANPSLRQSL